MSIFPKHAAGAQAWNQAANQASAVQIDEGLRSHMIGIYNWMVSALLLTAISAYLIANTGLSDLFFTIARTPSGGVAMNPTLLGWIGIFSPLAFVLVINFGITRLPLAASRAVFWAFAACIGISMSSVLRVYTGASITSAFFVTAAMFAAMSLWGYTTKRDLTRMGSFLIMAVFGLIVASLVNIFLLESGLMSLLCSVAVVVIFTLLTAYDTQRIRTEYLSGDFRDGSAAHSSLLHALSLYLNVINIFQALLSLTGERESN